MRDFCTEVLTSLIAAALFAAIFAAFAFFAVVVAQFTIGLYGTHGLLVAAPVGVGIVAGTLGFFTVIFDG